MFNYKEINASELEFIEIASVDELEIGERLFVEIDDLAIVLFNVGGEYYAIGDVCSHDDGPLGDGEVEDHSISCPRHGAEFDIRTGKVLSLPAVIDIPAYPVRVVSGQIQIGFPKDR